MTQCRKGAIVIVAPAWMKLPALYSEAEVEVPYTYVLSYSLVGHSQVPPEVNLRLNEPLCQMSSPFRDPVTVVKTL